MKYFTSDWYSGKKPTKDCQEYYEIMEENYSFYPQWYKEFNCLSTGKFIFHDSLIGELTDENGNLHIECIGIDIHYNKTVFLVLYDAVIIEKPERIEGCTIVAEELYCDHSGTEFHFLITDDDIDYTMNLTIKCKKVDLLYKKESKKLKLKLQIIDFINRFKKRNRIKRKIDKKSKTKY